LSALSTNLLLEFPRSDRHFSGNTIRGDGLFGIALDSFGFFAGDQFDLFDNQLAGNNFDDFQPAMADVLLDPNTRDNLYIGTDETVLDQGTNNTIILND